MVLNQTTLKIIKGKLLCYYWDPVKSLYSKVNGHKTHIFSMASSNLELLNIGVLNLYCYYVLCNISVPYNDIIHWQREKTELFPKEMWFSKTYESSTPIIFYFIFFLFVYLLWMAWQLWPSNLHKGFFCRFYLSKSNYMVLNR